MATANSYTTPTNGTRQITQNMVTDAPPDSDVEGGPLTVTVVGQPQHAQTFTYVPLTGSFTYRPQGGYKGTDTFTYYVTDSGGLQSQTVTVTITAA